MLEIVKAGGWLMVPIVACSIVAVAIFFERLWTLPRALGRAASSRGSRRARRSAKCSRPASRRDTRRAK